MRMLFDSFGRYENPHLILCNPGSKNNNGIPTLAYGELPLVSDIEIIYNYNDLSELNFRSYYAQADKYRYVVDAYMGLQKYKYIYVDGVGYFRIECVTETLENGTRVKDVNALSCEIELKNCLLPYIEDGTYPLFGFNSETGMYGIINVALENDKNWSIGYIDPDVADFNRSFTDVDVSKDVYTFLTTDVQDAYGCVVLFDILSRTISVVAASNVGTDTNIHLTGDDLVESIKVSDTSDGPYTAFRVFGDDAISISAVNPLGSNVVYDFSSYIPWMSESLGNKVAAWQNLVESSEVDYYEVSVDYFRKKAQADNIYAEIDKLNIQLALYQTCMDNIISTRSTTPIIQTNTELEKVDGDPIEVSDDISQALFAVDAKITSVESSIQDESDAYDAISEDVDDYNEQRTLIHNSVDMNTYFTSDEIRVLSNYIFEKTYTDNYITIDGSASVFSEIEDMNLIYNRAKNALKTASDSAKEFSISTEDFLFVEEFLPWIEQITPACTIHVEISDLNVIKLFLSSVAVNYEDKSTRLTFSNKLTKTDRRSLFNDLFKDVVVKSITNVIDKNTPYYEEDEENNE